MPGVHPLSYGRKTFRPFAAILSGLLVSTPAWSTDESAIPATATTNAAESTAEIASPTGRVARAIFTTAIADREPVDDLKTLPNSTSRVYFFSDLRELAGEIVTHRWEYDGQVMAEVTFKVGAGARWRVYSSKNLLPEWTGTWTVVINNESGQTLQSSSFEYTAAAQ